MYLYHDFDTVILFQYSIIAVTRKQTNMKRLQPYRHTHMFGVFLGLSSKSETVLHMMEGCDGGVFEGCVRRM